MRKCPWGAHVLRVSSAFSFSFRLVLWLVRRSHSLEVMNNSSILVVLQADLHHYFDRFFVGSTLVERDVGK